MTDSHHIKWRIDPEALDSVIDAGGYHSKSELFREAVRKEADRLDVELTAPGR
jgi:Arc/MetJ-type ribon-helix-helix transcriptional regulator